MVFSTDEQERYARHFILPGIGEEGQARLKRAKVLVVGAGGLGCPLLQYLTAAGVGTIGIVDHDVVDKSNLHRQVLYSDADIGNPKAETAAAKLRQQNPNVNFIVYNTRLSAANAAEIISGFDIVADGTDNFATRYLVNDACVLLGKINVYASIFRFEGQASVFNLPQPDGSRGPNYRDLFPEPPPEGSVPSCAEGGVLGVLPGILGSIQANETIKVITGNGEPLSGKLFVIQTLSMKTSVFRISLNADNPLRSGKVSQLTDLPEHCMLNEVREISFPELEAYLLEEHVQLIDVRESFEREEAHIGGKHIPVQEIAGFHPGESCQKIILYCQSGKRSMASARVLMKKFPDLSICSLSGGISNVPSDKRIT